MGLNLAVMLHEAARTEPQAVALRAGHTVTGTELNEYVRGRVASYEYARSVEFRASLPEGAGDEILERAR